MAQLVGVLSYTTKVCRFDSWSGHIPRLQVRSLVGLLMRGNIPMFLPHVSLSPSSPPSVPLSLKSINIFSNEDCKKKMLYRISYLKNNLLGYTYWLVSKEHSMERRKRVITSWRNLVNTSIDRWFSPSSTVINHIDNTYLIWCDKSGTSPLPLRSSSQNSIASV